RHGIGIAKRRPDRADDEESRQQHSFGGQSPGQRRTAPLLDIGHKERSRRAGNQKDRDGERRQEKAVLAARDLRTGGDEAAGHLRDKKTEQREKRAAIDVSRNKAQDEGKHSFSRIWWFVSIGHEGTV